MTGTTADGSPIGLGKFRNAKALYWDQATVFTPGQSVDGTLYAGDDPDGFPLDTYTTDEVAFRHFTRGWKDKLTVLPSGARAFPAEWSAAAVGVVSDAQTLTELHETIRGWAKDSLGRDIEFATRQPDGTFEPVGPDEVTA